MSAATPLAAARAQQPARSPQRGAPHRPPLRVVTTAPITAGRLPFVLLVAGVLVTGLVALLLLHTLAAQDAFRLHDLQRQSASLSDSEQQLAVAVQQAQSPAGLAARARALGMVPTTSLAFIRLRDGRIVGKAKAALPPPAPSPSVSPSPSASASASPSASSSASPSPSASSTRATPTASAATATTSRTHRHRTGR